MRSRTSRATQRNPVLKQHHWISDIPGWPQTHWIAKNAVEFLIVLPLSLKYRESWGAPHTHILYAVLGSDVGLMCASQHSTPTELYP